MHHELTVQAEQPESKQSIEHMIVIRIWRDGTERKVKCLINNRAKFTLVSIAKRYTAQGGVHACLPTCEQGRYPFLAQRLEKSLPTSRRSKRRNLACRPALVGRYLAREAKHTCVPASAQDPAVEFILTDRIVHPFSFLDRGFAIFHPPPSRRVLLRRWYRV